jgi:hypothetical protein
VARVWPASSTRADARTHASALNVSEIRVGADLKSNPPKADRKPAVEVWQSHRTPNGKP